jgi:hypothetical protein
MTQPEDALLDLIVRIRRAASSLADSSEDGEWSDAQRDVMAAKSEGLSMAVRYAEMQLAESRGEQRRAY